MSNACVFMFTGDKIALNYYNSPSALNQLPVVYCVCAALALLYIPTNLNDVNC